MSTASAAAEKATDEFGIADSYYDAAGKLHRTPEATRAAILAAMGEGAATETARRRGRCRRCASSGRATRARCRRRVISR